jgi:hypothetical protein
MNDAQQTEINMDTQRGRRVTIYLEPSIADQLQEWCETEERTMTYAIGKALGMWFDAQRAPNHANKPTANRVLRVSSRASDHNLTKLILDMLTGGPRKWSDIVLAALDLGYSGSQAEEARRVLKKKRRIGVFRAGQGTLWHLVQKGQVAQMGPSEQKSNLKQQPMAPMWIRVRQIAEARAPMPRSDCYSLGEFVSISRIVEKHKLQKLTIRDIDPLPYHPLSDSIDSQKFGFPRAETDAWLARNGYGGAK